MAKNKNTVVELVETTTEIEAPYELPEGWKWVKASDIANIYTGNSISEDVKRKKYTNISEGLNYIGTKDVDFDGTINYENGVKISDYENFKTVPASTPLLCIEGGSSGKKIGITNEQVCFGNKLCAFVCNETNPKLIYYFLQTNIFFYLFMKERHGLIGGVSVGSIKNIPIPLPPTLEEQQRIVNRIETLFAKLDEAKEKAQNVVDTFETRKASILHKAFTGELTKKWREEKDVSYNLIKSKFSEICTKITDGFHNSPKPVVNGYPYIMAGDIKDGGINFNNGLFMDEKNHNELYKKASPSRGDILIVNIGAGTGKAAIIDVDFEFSFKNCAILKLKRDIVNPMYVYQFFLLEKNNILINITRGGAQPFLSLKMINDMEISYPSLPEQTEIVRILDVILEKETKAKEAAEAVLDQIDLLKKSILARAFRGEL